MPRLAFSAAVTFAASLLVVSPSVAAEPPAPDPTRVAALLRNVPDDLVPAGVAREVLAARAASPQDGGGRDPGRRADTEDTQDTGDAVTSLQSCSGDLRLTPLADRIAVGWSVDPGRTLLGVDVQRGRWYEAPATVAALPSSARSWDDAKSAGDHDLYAYAVRLRYSDGTVVLQACDPAVRARTDAVGGTTLWQSAPGVGTSVEQSPTGMAATPAYSPNGRSVVYAWSADGDGQLDLYLRPAAGGAPVRLTGTVADDELDPAWSPDGRRVVYTRYGWDGSVSLWQVDVVTRATGAVPGGANAGEPVFLPNGTLVATDLGSDTAPLLRISATGARSHVAGTSGGFDAAVSADGARLAYVRVDVAGEEMVDRLLVLPSAGGTPREVVSTSQEFILSPRWNAEERRWWWEQHTGWWGRYWTAAADGAGLAEANPGLPESGWGFDLRTPVTPSTSDFTGDAISDVVVRDAGGTLWLYPRGPQVGSWSPRRVIGTGWNGMTMIEAVGDLTADGRADLLARDSSGRLLLYPGDGTGRVTAARQIGSGWGAFTAVRSAGDLTRDGLPDLIARRSDGTLWVYAANGAGGIREGQRIGSGWNGMSLITSVDDATADGVGDVVARRTDGTLWLYAGNGRGGVLEGRRIGTGWGAITSLAGIDGDVTTQWPASLLARHQDGSLLQYAFVGGRITSDLRIGTGWQGFTAFAT